MGGGGGVVDDGGCLLGFLMTPATQGSGQLVGQTSWPITTSKAKPRKAIDS